MINQDSKNKIYNRFDKDAHKHERALGIRANRVIQSAEINEIQSQNHAHIKRTNDVLFKQGDIVRGSGASLDKSTGALTVAAGAVYLNGDIYELEPFTATLPTTGKVQIGVWLTTTYLTESDDPSLRNPAVGTRGANEPGAVRIVITARWGLPDETPNTSAVSDVYYPIINGNNGYLDAKEPPPHITSLTQAIAKYDRDSTGSQYVISGLRVTAVDTTTVGEQGYVIDAGRARIGGFAIEYPTSRRFSLAINAPTAEIESEPHLATGTAQRINVNRAPIASIDDIRIHSQKTVTITHGNHANIRDALPDATVVSVLEVKQGSTVYSQGSDYQLATGEIDWTLVGNEPAPGSTYEVTYQYIQAGVATDVDTTGFTIDGAVAGTLITVDYTHYLKRIDRLCLDERGEPHLIKGVDTYHRPLAPHVPDSLLLLATIHQDFISSSLERVIDQDGQRLVSMAELNIHKDRLDYLTELLAQTRLEQSAAMGEAGRKRGMFADPFMTNAFRDLGITQTAIITAGRCSINVNVQSHTFNLIAPLHLPYASEAIIEQPLSSECMLINPYAALDLPPAQVTLQPAVDRWVVNDDTWLTPIVNNTTTGNTRGHVDTISDKTSAIEHLRSISVNVNIEGFTPTEALTTATFDGINIMPATTQTADSNGVINFDFTIPGGVPAGRKLVAVTGDRGTEGQAIFVGQGTLNERVFQLFILRRIDPLAQTFTIEDNRQIGTLDLWFCTKGTKPVIVQIRETLVGVPTQKILAQTFVQADDINLNDLTTVQFPAPVALQANVEYAIVVLSTEITPKLKVAHLGARDDDTGNWITSQPYAVGALLSSSNASTWTPHNGRDMKFTLNKCAFTQTTLREHIGDLAVAGITDLAVFMDVETPASGTQALIEAILPDGTKLQFADGQSIELAQAVTGTIAFHAVLTGTPTASPVIYSNVQVLTGVYTNTGNYITRAIPADPTTSHGSRVRVLFDAFTPTGATVTARARGIINSVPQPWQALFQRNVMGLDNNKAEYTFETDANQHITANDIQVEVLLNGTPAARPIVENLRVLVIEGL